MGLKMSQLAVGQQLTFLLIIAQFIYGQCMHRKIAIRQKVHASQLSPTKAKRKMYPFECLVSSE